MAEYQNQAQDGIQQISMDTITFHKAIILLGRDLFLFLFLLYKRWGWGSQPNRIGVIGNNL
jgi:hypothetical protein